MGKQQPQALKILLLTEMCERFGFYIVPALLVFYLQDLHYPTAQAYAILGEFTGLAYITPIFGGWLADYCLGNRLAIILGGLFQCLGYALLALSPVTLYAGLALIILGAAFLKPSVSNFLGQFYAPNDARRVTGFTLFYMGICSGISLSMFVSGYILQLFGWHACFAVASIALMLGLWIFCYGYRYFANKGFAPNTSITALWQFMRYKPSVIAWSALLLLGISVLLRFSAVGSYGLFLSVIAFYVYIIITALKAEVNSRCSIFALLLLFILSTIYWGLFFQMFLATNVFTQTAVNRVVFGQEIPSSVFLGIETLFVLLLGPVISQLWQRLKFFTSIAAKFALALFLIGLSMQVLVWVIPVTANNTAAVWLILVYILIAVSDLLLSPSGLASITVYAPQKMQNLLMGGWLMSMGLGGKLAGLMASLALTPPGVVTITELNQIYRQAFQVYAYIGFAAVILCLCCIPLINYLLRKPLDAQDTAAVYRTA